MDIYNSCLSIFLTPIHDNDIVLILKYNLIKAHTVAFNVFIEQHNLIEIKSVCAHKAYAY